MVSPHPDLQRKFKNTDNIVKAQKHYLVPNLYVKYPQDYLDLITHDKLSKIKPWIETIPKKQSQQTLSTLSNRKVSNSNIKKLQSPVIDKILILCVDFNDVPSMFSTSEIYDRYFSPIGTSFRNYYNEVSYNQYTPVGEVHGWYRAPFNSTFYTAGNNGLGIYPFNTQKLVEDVLDIARNDPSINWASFDTNGNGYLDSVIIVHSGSEGAMTSYIPGMDDFWAHVWGLVFPKTIQGKVIDTYALSAEYLHPLFLDQVSGIDCHEFGHLLDLPDLYDYSGNSNGVGDFSLMGSGSWADIANTPVHLDAWSKYFLGWSNTIENPVGIVSIQTAQLNPDNYKYTTSDPLEYFMVENRQDILFDSYLPAYGLLIWHINERQQYNDNELCFKVGLIQADGMKDLENQMNSGDGGDSYPGFTNNRSFGPYTIPKSSLCNNTTKDISINNISDPANIMSFNSYLPTSPLGSIKFVAYPSASDIYFDTTYKGTTDPITGILIINNIPIGMINYTVKKTGYYDRSGSVEVIADTTTVVSVILTVLPGTVNITSTPSGAKIYMDNVDTGQITPATITNLSVGSHTYKLILTGYYDKTGAFLISAGQMLNINVNLNRITKGELAIFSNPPGANIYIDNIDTLQITPVNIPDIEEGNHTYKLVLQGYYDNIGTFNIVATQTTTVNVGNLIPLPMPTGILYIISNPTGAEVYIDDIDTLQTTSATIPNIGVGSHTYKLTLAGYYDKTNSFDIIADQTTTVNVGNLIPIPPTTGTLYITSNPSGANIYIDDINRQTTTPATILNLLPGSYTYKLTLTGYKDKIGTFDIIIGEETIIDAGDLEMIVSEAGMSTAGMILVAGMLMGSLFMKKPTTL
jgi:immune inhibitor A